MHDSFEVNSMDQMLKESSQNRKPLKTPPEVLSSQQVMDLFELD